MSPQSVELDHPMKYNRDNYEEISAQELTTKDKKAARKKSICWALFPTHRDRKLLTQGDSAWIPMDPLSTA